MAAEYPASAYTPNPQTQPVLPSGGTDVANASDYNKHDEEIEAVTDDLRAANVNGGEANHADVHFDQEARISALEAGGGGGGPDVYIIKSADESESGTALQDDDELKFSVLAGEVWTFDLTIYNDNGISYTIDIGTGTPAIDRFHPTARNFGDVNTNFGFAGIKASYTINGTLDNTGGSDTTVAFRWARDPAASGTTIVEEGSRLLAWKQ